MNYYFEPVNLTQWNMFDKVKDIGHIEHFLATKSMRVGDMVLLHVGCQHPDYQSGICAYGVIKTQPYILEKSPLEYCNGKLTVDVVFTYINDIPLFTHEECKRFCHQFRTVHRIKDEYNIIIDKRIKEL